jgi:carbon-monoxide dehydrogenase medium subunit
MNGFRYERPTTVAQATALLANAAGTARVLAGGTDLVVALRSGAVRPEFVVDIKQVEGLREIRWTPAGDLELGAAVEVRRIYEDRRIAATFPALAEGAAAIGSLQIRNRATIGGNLANASPCMDTAPPLLVLGASVRLAGSKGERSVPLQGFFIDVKRTVLAPDEVLVAVTVPAPAAGLRSAFEKVKRIDGHDLALVNAAATFDPAARTLRAAVGSCGVTPILLPPLTDIARSAAAKDVGQRLATVALEHICPIDDVRASAEYRRDMTALLCRRLAERLLGKSTGRR